MAELTSALLFASVFLLVMALSSLWKRLSTSYISQQIASAKALSMDQTKIDQGMAWWGISLGVNLLVSWLLGMLLIGVATTGLLLAAPRWILDWRIQRRRELLRDQMVQCAVALANSVRAGQSLSDGLETVSDELPQPLALELKQIVAEYHHGRPLAEALQEAKRRLKIDSFSLFVSAIVVNLDRGGKVTESLERISRSLQENQRIERKLQAETASGWRVVLILAAFPLLFLGGFYVLHPEGTSMVFQTLIGQGVLLCVMGLVFVSVWWSRKILTMDA
ncbi:type II secretion system F family protein [Aureliella helgolandensis]|uniref:Bacterial type II secretion system protein F domain protein n=1 Tax=Aureliella helgolandensis TaxID=2527968 RepID=A0A518G138_9BACT|nr:type II secretion system F family protein [Aureliella helgolandensis]QDV22321.1 Bacterial type II secretion system protein F domain protein [Aureliella helgolandensis]